MTTRNTTVQSFVLKLVPLAVAAAIALPLSGCRAATMIDGGELQTITDLDEVTDFDALQISSSFEVEIVRGDEHKLELRVGEGAADEVTVEQDGDTLKLGRKGDSSLWSFGNADGRLEATITMPRLRELRLSGASDATMTGFDDGEDMKIDVSGASELRGTIRSGDLAIDAAGASSITLEGEGDAITVDGSGASSIDLSDLRVREADIDASGASEVELDVEQRLSADASGASSVRYRGEPELDDIRTSGASSVEPR